MSYIEAEFNAHVIWCLVLVYLLHCSTLSPLRFISSGNIFNFSCMEAFAHCFIACWGCALSIISEVSGENTIKTQAKVSLKHTNKGLKQIEKKQNQMYKIAQKPENQVWKAQTNNLSVGCTNPSTVKLKYHGAAPHCTTFPGNRKIWRLLNKATFISAAPTQQAQRVTLSSLAAEHRVSTEAAKLLIQWNARYFSSACSQLPTN